MQHNDLCRHQDGAQGMSWHCLSMQLLVAVLVLQQQRCFLSYARPVMLTATLPCTAYVTHHVHAQTS